MWTVIDLCDSVSGLAADDEPARDYYWVILTIVALLLIAGVVIEQLTGL